MRGEQELVGQPLERLVHALGRLLRRGQKLYAGAIRLFFLRTLVGQQRTADCLLWSKDRGGGAAHVAARTSRRHDGPDTEQHGDDRLRMSLCELLAQPREMAAGDMAELVRQHPDDL